MINKIHLYFNQEVNENLIIIIISYKIIHTYLIKFKTEKKKVKLMS